MCVCVYVCTCIYIYIRIYIGMYVHIYTYMYNHINVYICDMHYNKYHDICIKSYHIIPRASQRGISAPSACLRCSRFRAEGKQLNMLDGPSPAGQGQTVLCVPTSLDSGRRRKSGHASTLEVPTTSSRSDTERIWYLPLS